MLENKFINEESLSKAGFFKQRKPFECLGASACWIIKCLYPVSSAALLPYDTFMDMSEESGHKLPGIAEYLQAYNLPVKLFREENGCNCFSYIATVLQECVCILTAVKADKWYERVNPELKIPSNVRHAITVLAYDPDTDEYLVLDTKLDTPVYSVSGNTLKYAHDSSLMIGFFR